MKKISILVFQSNVNGIYNPEVNIIRTSKLKRIDFKNSIHKKYILNSFSGSRKIAGVLNRDRLNVQRGLVKRYRKEMNLKGLTLKRKINYPKNPVQKLPYLLRDLKVMVLIKYGSQT